MDQRSPSSSCRRHANLWQVHLWSLSIRAAHGPHGPLKRSASPSPCDWATNKKTRKRVTCLDSLTTTLYPTYICLISFLSLSIPHSVTLSICGFWSSQISVSWYPFLVCCSGNAGTNEAERLIFPLPHHSGLSPLTVSFFFPSFKLDLFCPSAL